MSIDSINGLKLFRFGNQSQNTVNGTNKTEQVRKSGAAGNAEKSGAAQRNTDVRLTKNGSIFSPDKNSSVNANSSVNSNYSQAAPSVNSDNMAEKSAKKDLSKMNFSDIDFDNLFPRYTMTELSQLNNDLKDMQQHDLPRFLLRSLDEKRHKVVKAMNQASEGTGVSINENAEETGKTGSTSSTGKSKSESDAQAAQSAYEQGKSSVGGVGLAATLSATKKTNAAKSKTEKETVNMNNEQSKMERQQEATEKFSKQSEKQINKLNTSQNDYVKKQELEEKKINDIQKTMEMTSANVSELESQYNPDSAKTDNEAQSQQKSFNGKIMAATSSLQESNTQVSQHTNKISNYSKYMKTNVKATRTLQQNTAKRFASNRNSIALAGSGVTRARVTAGNASGTSSAAQTVGTASSALGTAVTITGQILEKSPKTAAVGKSMVTYGTATTGAAGVTTSVAAMTQNSSGVTGTAAGGAQSRANAASRSNRNISMLNKRAGVQIKSFDKLNKTAEKAAQNVRTAASNTFEESSKSISMTQTSVEGNFANRNVNNNSAPQQNPKANNKQGMTNPLNRFNNGVRNNNGVGFNQGVNQNQGAQQDNNTAPAGNNSQENTIAVNPAQKKDLLF